MKLLLVDGFYYAYRSFHSMPALRNPEGAPTGAIYGFLKALRRMVREVQPDRAAVVWDEGLPERRTLLQPAYKAHRTEMPEDLQLQIEPMREVLGLLGFSNVFLPGTEADDLMASYAVAASGMGWESVLATVDKDLFQIVGGAIWVYAPQKEKQGGGGLVGEEEVRAKWGVAPRQLGDVLSLLGDASDNIPGVPGIGPKGAAALVAQFESLEGVYARLGEVKSERVREKLREYQAQVFQNREMVRLDLDLPLPVAVEALRITPKYPQVLEAVRRCGFKTLLRELEAEAPGEATGSLPAERQGELF